LTAVLSKLTDHSVTFRQYLSIEFMNSIGSILSRI
jgi:hypothetical protein